jgi:hypothetical protein
LIARGAIATVLPLILCLKGLEVRSLQAACYVDEVEQTLKSEMAQQQTHALQQDALDFGFALAAMAANLLTNAALDPFGKIPEFKFCAMRVEPVGIGTAAEQAMAGINRPDRCQLARGGCLVGTNRMLGLVTASQIASASGGISRTVCPNAYSSRDR